MVAQTGKDNLIKIKKEVLKKICSTLKKYHYETGGIIGTDENGVISAFQFDKITAPRLYEYCPNTMFLDNIINNEWAKSDINFIGFVHSHLNNAVLSPQDIKYARKILAENDSIKEIVIGVINLNANNNIKWYMIN